MESKSLEDWDAGSGVLLKTDAEMGRRCQLCMHCCSGKPTGQKHDMLMWFDFLLGVISSMISAAEILLSV